MINPRTAWLMLKYLGPDWVAFRLRYALQRRLGILKRSSPCLAWADIPAADCLPDWFQSSRWPESGQGWGNRCIIQADGLTLGEFVLFSYHQKLLGTAPDWHRNSFTGQSAPRGQHWSELGDFDFGDIKAIWEPSRCGWAITLARAHARTRETRLAECFWKYFEDWCAKNPPNEGVNWKCGQEATFRLMALTFAITEFGRLPNATATRMELWSRFVIITGRRIAANLDFALSQSNNHGVSECVGLITASLLAADTGETRAWRERGLRELRKQVEKLIYEDGGFSQHSLIYHRVLLHDLLWLVSLLRRAGQNAPDWLVAKTRLALTFLAALVEPTTGRGPLYGANDGSNVLPLDDGEFADMRGVLQAGFALLYERRIFPPGSWDEAAFWLTAKDPASLPSPLVEPSKPWHASASGCFLWRSGETRLFLRCPTHFLHRPAQADMLHIDLWWRGQAVVHDGGTFSYNCPGPFDGAFSKAATHNAPMLAGREPLQKVSRFLYLPWPTGTAGWTEAGQCFSATHEGYGSAAQVERSITLMPSGVFVVRDRVNPSQPTQVRLHWLLVDAEWKLDETARTVSAKLSGGNFTLGWECNQSASAVSLVRADPASARGWWSQHYLAVEPAVSLELLFDVEDSVEITTRFTPSP